MDNTAGILMLKPEPACDVAVKWLIWLGAMILLVLLLIYITGISNPKKCDFDSDYDTGRLRARGILTY